MNNEQIPRPMTFPGAGIERMNIQQTISNPNMVPMGNVTVQDNIATNIVDELNPNSIPVVQPSPRKAPIQTENDEIPTIQQPSPRKAPIQTENDEIPTIQQPTEEPLTIDRREGSEISPVFADLLEGANILEEQQENPSDVSNLLSNIKIDLSTIDIEEESVDKINSVMSLLTNKPVKQVVNCQSSYVSYHSALNNSELRSLDDSDTDIMTYRKRLARLIHKHIEDTSIGKIDFPTYEKITSYFDLETQIYGTYCQSFPYDNSYTIPACPGPECGKEYKTIVSNNTLVETRNRNEVFDRIDSIIANVKNPNDVVKNSLLGKTKRKIVEESKIIFDIRIPSIYNYLEETLKFVSSNIADEHPAAVGTAIFISKVYLPDIVELKRSGKLKYIPVTDRQTIINILIKLSLKDSSSLTKEIDAVAEKYKVTYSLKNVTCPHCGHVIEEIPLNMEQMLFLTLRQEIMGEN